MISTFFLLTKAPEATSLRENNQTLAEQVYKHSIESLQRQPHQPLSIMTPESILAPTTSIRYLPTTPS